MVGLWAQHCMQKAHKNRMKFSRQAASGSALQKSAPSRGGELKACLTVSLEAPSTMTWSDAVRERSAHAASPGFPWGSLRGKSQGITPVVFWFRPTVGGGISVMVFLVIRISLLDAILCILSSQLESNKTQNFYKLKCSWFTMLH